MPFPCAACSVSAGPVTNLGQDQAVYVDVTGIPIGYDIGLALCSLARGDQVQPYPTCASNIPPPKGCEVQGGGPCPNSSSPLEWQYGQAISSSTVLSIGTEYDPNIPDAVPIISQSSQTGAYGSFFCDNAADPCGIEVTDISDVGDVIGDGYPPSVQFQMSTSNTVVIPISFSQSGNGCGSAPAVQVDAAYSAAQFLPAAGAATCTNLGGVAVIPTDLPSVDDSGCSSGTGTHCPITDVISGNVPATFTDDPEDPATLAELQKGGGKFAYIPISVSSTEIAFLGAAGFGQSGHNSAIPLDSYELTPAQAAGILTYTWTDPEAQEGEPDDDLCGQLPSTKQDPAKCVEAMQTSKDNLLVEVVDGKYENVDVGTASFNGKPKTLPFTTFQYGYPDNYYQQTTPGTASNYSFDTGFALLNPWPPLVGTNTPVNEDALSAMFPSTASGSVYQLTGWLCGAPQLPYTIPNPPPYIPNDTLLQDITSSQQLLSNAENGPLVVTKEKGGYTVSNTVYQSTIQNPSKCQTLSTLPTDFASAQAGVADRYLPSSSPVTAAHVVDGALPNFAGTGGFAFTGMDSSEADFYGLLPAALQNAAGSFELPTPSSVLAALNDETTNADGTLSPNFDDTGDTGAYPMPMVTYALVSTAPQPSLTEAAELKDMLTNLVGYSHSAGAGTTDPLPSGYVPLPDNLYQDALADIAKDVVGPGGVAPPSPGTPGTPGNTGSPGAPGQQGVATGRGTAFHFNTGGAASRSGASAASGSSGAVSSGGTGDYFGHLITVTLGDSRFFIPGLLLLALVCLIGGPLLYLYPSLRKAHAGADGDVESEGSEPSAPEAGPDG